MPTKVNLQRRIQQADTTCSLCKSDEETYVHLFFLCPFAKALWTTVGWGFRFDSASLTSNEDIISLIINPTHAPIPTDQHWTITLNMALIIDEIWKTGNHFLFHGGIVDVNKAMNNARVRFLEASKVYSPNSRPSVEQSVDVWSPPPQGWIKINVDAALSNSKSALAVVARNHLGIAISIWGKEHHLCSPVQAEAEAILWAVQIAIQERWSAVIFEGDAKLCFDPLSQPDLIPSWPISTLICNIRSLVSCFVSCEFKWVQRKCNVAAHEAARLALNSYRPFCFSYGNFPPSLEAACKGDYSSVPVV